MGKSDRAFVFGLLALLLGRGVRPGAWLVVAQGAILALLLVTVWNRAAHALREGRE
jgi:CDP-diacylglycerol--glycerol-3-phosphate 3-phosphatidyltransferase